MAEQITEAALRERIGVLEKAREGFIEQANRQLTGYAARIAELKRLLGEPAATPPATTPLMEAAIPAEAAVPTGTSESSDER